VPHLRNSFLHIRDKSLLLHTELSFCAEPATTTPDKTKEQPAAPQVQQQRARKAGECWGCGEKWVPGHKCKLIPTINVMQETYTPNDATEEIAVQEEEEMKSHRIRTPLQMSISCIFRLMQFQGWSLLAHFKSRSLLVDKQALPLLIPAVQVHSLICLSQLKPLAISKKSAQIAVAGGGQLTSRAIIADTAFSIQKHAFNNNLRVLDLKEYDVMIGSINIAHLPSI
jgi:hypothetical protein